MSASLLSEFSSKLKALVNTDSQKATPLVLPYWCMLAAGLNVTSLQRF